jgi:hypothetical protein
MQRRLPEKIRRKRTDDETDYDHECALLLGIRREKERRRTRLVRIASALDRVVTVQSM